MEGSAIIYDLIIMINDDPIIMINDDPIIMINEAFLFKQLSNMGKKLTIDSQLVRGSGLPHSVARQAVVGQCIGWLHIGDDEAIVCCYGYPREGWIGQQEASLKPCNDGGGVTIGGTVQYRLEPSRDVDGAGRLGNDWGLCGGGNVSGVGGGMGWSV